jgi:hypothetical protein
MMNSVTFYENTEGYDEAILLKKMFHKALIINC